MVFTVISNWTKAILSHTKLPSFSLLTSKSKSFRANFLFMMLLPEKNQIQTQSKRGICRIW
jgi:hypothetical protein